MGNTKLTIVECKNFLLDEIDLADNDGIPETKKKLEDVLYWLQSVPEYIDECW